MAWIAIAGDCSDCNNAPSFPGNATRCKGDSNPIINVTFAQGMDTIDSSHPVTLSASEGCPPYTWSTASKGYSLIDNKNGTMALSVINGVCGISYDVYCTVTVTDACGIANVAYIRNASGHWVSDLGGGASGCGSGYSARYSHSFYLRNARYDIQMDVCNDVTYVTGEATDGPLPGCNLGNFGATCPSSSYITSVEVTAFWEQAKIDSGFNLRRCAYSWGNYNTAYKTSCVLGNSPNTTIERWSLYHWSCP